MWKRHQSLICEPALQHLVKRESMDGAFFAVRKTLD